MMPLSFATQIATAEREIQQHLRVYPRLVGNGRMTQQRADRETEAMRCILGTLKACQQLVERCEAIRRNSRVPADVEAELDCLLEPLRQHQPSLPLAG